MERYYQPEIETMPRDQLKALQSERLVKQVKHVWDNVPYYRKKMEARQGMLKSLVDEGKKHQSDWQNPMLSAAAKAELQKKLEDVQRRMFAIQQEMRTEDQRYQEELADLQQRLFKIEKKDVEARLSEFAKDEGYDLIVDIAACGFSKPGLDVTDAVLKKMGVKNPKK